MSTQSGIFVLGIRKRLLNPVLAAALLAAGAGGLTPGQAYANLIGDSVHATYRFPDFATVFQDLGTQTIAVGTVFDVTAAPFGPTATFSASQITITNNDPTGFVISAFNGFDFAFLSGTAITNVTEDPTSNSSFAMGSVLNFSANDISLNLAGTCLSNCAGGEKIILDVTTATAAVPEPASLALLGTAVAGLIPFGFRAKRQARRSPRRLIA
jgi:hypothetical protein